MNTKWTDYIGNNTYIRLAQCQTIKDDFAELVNARWYWMMGQGMNKEGFTKEDALIYVLELLEANGLWEITELTADEYNELKK